MLLPYKNNNTNIIIETNLTNNNNSIEVPGYKNNGIKLKGAKYLPDNEFCMKTAFPSSFKDSDGKISNLAQQGTVVHGGAPDKTIYGDSEHTLTLTTSGILKLDEKELYNYGNKIPYCKIWVSACAGGGGGASSEGEGGAGAGYAFFPIFIQSGNSIYFYVGGGGSSSGSDIITNGHDGNDTIFWEALSTLTKDNYKSARIFAYIERGHGGHDANRSTESDHAYGGGVAIYSGVAKNIRKNDKEFNTSESVSGYKYITSAVALNNIYRTSSDFIAVLDSNKDQKALQKRSTNESVFIVNGCCGGNGNASTSANGDSITINLEKNADYAQIYNKSSWTNNGGTGKSGGGFNNDKSSGGGACAFPGSFAGDGGDPGTTDTLLRSWTIWNLRSWWR